MKKITSLLLCSILMFSITSCGNSKNISSESTDNLSYPDEENITRENLPNLDSYDYAVMESTEEQIEESDLNGTNKESTDDLESIYEEARKLYTSGDWDGHIIELDGHTISISDSFGDVLVDHEQIPNSLSLPVDLPANFDYEAISSNIEYIPGNGVFCIKDRKLVKYSHGKLVSLGGGELNYKGLDIPYYQNTTYPTFEISSPYLYYVPEADKLLLVTKEPYENLRYLYVFPDYNVSKIGSFETITDFCVASYGDGDIFSYCDTDGKSWIYYKDGPVSLDDFKDLKKQEN